MSPGLPGQLPPAAPPTTDQATFGGTPANAGALKPHPSTTTTKTGTQADGPLTANTVAPKALEGWSALQEAASATFPDLLGRSQANRSAAWAALSRAAKVRH